MDQHADLPPTPPTEPNPFALELPMFDIPNVETLRTLVQAEEHAVRVVHAKVRAFMEPGLALLGADGKPTVEAGAKLQERITAYLHELLEQPTVAEEWVAAPSSTLKQVIVTGASFQIAYMIYQEFGRLVRGRLPEFVQILDAAMILGMTALHHGIEPVESYQRSFQAKTKDNQGIEVLGQEEAFKQRQLMLQGLLYQFLTIKGMLSPETPRTLTEAGVRLLNHLSSVLGSTESMKQQGPALMEAVMGQLKQGETISSPEVPQGLAPTQQEA